jgi:hypothetical protein
VNWAEPSGAEWSGGPALVTRCRPVPQTSAWYRWVALAVLAGTACTRLDSPNDRFKVTLENTGGTRGAAQDGGFASVVDAAASPAGGGGPARDSGSGGSPSDGGGVPLRSDASSNAGTGGQAPREDAGCTRSIGSDVRCYTCAPTDLITLETACTSASCKPFDLRKRLTKLGSDGSLPPLPGSSGSGGATSSGGATASGGAAGAGGVEGTGGSGTGVGVPCENLRSRGQILYVTGSSASKPFLQTIAQQIAGQNVFIVYSSTGSCVGVDAIVNGTPMTSGPSPAPAASATYWDSSSSPGTACDLPPGGTTANLGVSDVFAQSCPGFELVSLDARGVFDAHGPIQTMTFVVPTNSRFTEISAEAAYFVFGFGSNGGVLDPTISSPIWNDESHMFRRSAASGTQAMIAATIGVPPALWKGQALKSSDDVAANIQIAGANANTADDAIGILAADYIDTKNLRAQIRVLAFQDTGQNCAVFPDSSGTARDKQNVRDGHYPIWSPLHLLYKVDHLGDPIDPSSRQALTDVVGYLAGTKPLPNGVKLIDVYAQSGLVPECAMHVSRTQDGGNITPRAPSTSCSCLFEAKATGTTTCTPCVVQGNCAAGETCSQGYCEH